MDTGEAYTGTALRRLGLHQEYEELGIPLSENDGWLLPENFRNIREEEALLESGRGYVDFSDHGVLRMMGNDAVDLLQRISTNDFRDFKEGSAVQTVLLSDKGRLVDSVVILHRNDHLMVITSRGANENVVKWIEKFIIMEDVTLTDETGRHFLFLHCNATPASHHAASNSSEHFVFNVKFFDVDSFFYGGSTAAAIRGQLGKASLLQVGNAAYEIFRIRHGIPAYGREIVAEFNPLELGLTRQVSTTKGCYIGQEVIARLDTYKKVQRKLCRVRIADRLSSGGARRIIEDGKEVGLLTSYVPDIEKETNSIGLAVMRSAFADVGAQSLVVDKNSELIVEHSFENDR